MKVLGQLENATLEILNADPSASTAGRVYYNTAKAQFILDDGAAKRAMLRNDAHCVFGSDATPANNIRFHRAGAGVLQFVAGSDATAQGSLSSALAQTSGRLENYVSEIFKPAFGNPGRLIWCSDIQTMQMDTGTSWIDISSLADGGVTTAKLANGAVTQAKRAPLGQQVSASSGAVNTTSSTFSDVANLSVTITTTGRPVWVGLIWDGSESAPFVSVSQTSATTGASPVAYLRMLRGATPVSLAELTIYFGPGFSVTPTYATPLSAFNTLDVPSAGTYTYKVQFSVSSDGAHICQVRGAKLVAYEL